MVARLGSRRRTRRSSTHPFVNYLWLRSRTQVRLRRGRAAASSAVRRFAVHRRVTLAQALGGVFASHQSGKRHTGDYREGSELQQQCQKRKPVCARHKIEWQVRDHEHDRGQGQRRRRLLAARAPTHSRRVRLHLLGSGPPWKPGCPAGEAAHIDRPRLCAVLFSTLKYTAGTVVI